MHTTLRVPKNYSGGHRRTTDRDVVDLVRELVLVSTDASFASILNRLGYRTGAGNTWTESRVLQVRRERDIPGHQKIAGRSWVTMAEAASELQVSTGTILTTTAAAEARGAQFDLLASSSGTMLRVNSATFRVRQNLDGSVMDVSKARQIPVTLDSPQPLVLRAKPGTSNPH